MLLQVSDDDDVGVLFPVHFHGKCLYIFCCAHNYNLREVRNFLPVPGTLFFVYKSRVILYYIVPCKLYDSDMCTK